MNKSRELWQKKHYDLPNECNCLYCGCVISKRASHRTCRECHNKWVALWGRDWATTQDWHAALVADYNAFINTERAATAPLAFADDAADHSIETGLSDDWLPATEFTEAFKVIKDLVLYYHEAGIRAGATKIAQELRGRGVSPIPKTRAIEKYTSKIRALLPPTDPDDPRLEHEQLLRRLLVLSAELDGRVMGGAAPSAPLTDLLAERIEMPPDDDYLGRARLLGALIIAANGNAANLALALPTLTHLSHDVTYAIGAGRL